MTTESKSSTNDAYANHFDSGIITGFGLNLPLTKKMIIGIDIRSALGLIRVPENYDEYGFQGFRETSKNIGFESGLKVQYNLK
ncbi:MAG: hypothetical protein WD431_17840 [Cyclobacteriaceae bacterium]